MAADAVVFFGHQIQTKDEVVLRIGIFDFTSHSMSERLLPKYGLIRDLLEMGRSTKQSNVMDDIMSANLMQGLQTALDYLSA